MTSPIDRLDQTDAWRETKARESGLAPADVSVPDVEAVAEAEAVAGVVVAEPRAAPAPELAPVDTPATAEQAPAPGRYSRFAFRAHPRLVAGVAAAVVIVVAAGTLLLGPAFPARVNGTMPGTAAGLALATPTEVPATPTPTPTPSPTPEPTPTPYPLMTPRLIIPVGDLTGYVWPLNRAQITLPFGPTYWGEMVVNGQLFHDGLDITTGCGDKVHAAHDGVVLAAGRHYDDYVGWAGDLTAYYRWLTTHRIWDTVPLVVVIDDGNGYRSIYVHEATLTVVAGQRVKAGDVIGIEGESGLATGCHVHYSIFNTLETQTFALNAGVIQRDHLPPAEIARVDPLLVLPLRCDLREQVALRPYDAAMTCGSRPGATPTTAP